MSTQVFGDIDVVMPSITQAMKKYETKQAIVVMKLGRGILKLS
ncbi:MAG: hypothetical protein NZ551_11320 [Microscillaceae bacterium]|nr:hypothetical protein [Microscillaceae bacterium]MDW8461786.1 hypothetical protein [Cytophagales bacterium]